MYTSMVWVMLAVLVAVGAAVLVAAAVAEFVERRRTPVALAAPTSIAPPRSTLKRAA